MPEDGFAIRCPRCRKWNVWPFKPEKVALKSVDEFERIMRRMSKARMDKKRDEVFSHRKLLRCKRARWSCPGSFEAFVFKKEQTALESLERVAEKLAISRIFRLFKSDTKSRWGKRYCCIMFCTEPVPRQRNIDLERLMDRELMSRSIVGMGYEMKAPLTVYAANIFEPEGEPPQLYWMPIEAYSPAGQVLVPRRFNEFCRKVRSIVMGDLEKSFTKRKISVTNCPMGFGKKRKCAGRDAACMQEPRKDWNHCPAFIEDRKKKCPCYHSDLHVIDEVRKMLNGGKTRKEGLPVRCNAGFKEIAFPIMVHNYLVGVAMTGQVFSNKRNLATVEDFVYGKCPWSDTRGSWTLLKKWKDELETARHAVFWEESKLRDKKEPGRFFVTKDELDERLALVRPNIAKLEEMANIRYRDIRSRSEEIFRQEVLAYIQENKIAPAFFKKPIVNVLKRMKEFWAFKAAGLLCHSSKEKDVRLIAFSSEKGARGYGLQGNRIGSLESSFGQSHPIAWFFDSSSFDEPMNEWGKLLYRLIKDARRRLTLGLPQQSHYLIVGVPFAEEVYAFVFIGRDTSRLSRLEAYKPRVVSELCEEFILETCTEVMYQLGDAQTFKEERERSWREFSALAAHRIGNEISSTGVLLDVLGGQLLKNAVFRKEWEDRLGVMGRCIARAKTMLVQQAMLTADIAPRPKKVSLQKIVDKAVTGVVNPSKEVIYRRAAVGKKIVVDPELMEQAFRELATNAVKYGGKNVQATIGVRETARNLQIVFEDDGPGIKNKDRDRIFEPYISSTPGGAGLGLVTVKRIIVAHKGRIRLCSSKVGAKFMITIPLGGRQK